ncbi:hypothetical protein MVEN_02273700 [Mycena venus]|uniref:Cytochrome P450 n=1 Tax=Mycena venus TaxID=2733690 RepID=A0A8H6X4R0_9AGAR|nr:hypothetical protein MVEN_02273700 [Mycena venus]
MYAILRLALPVFATAGAYVLLQVAQFLFRDLCSPLRKLVGPKSPSFVWGNVKEMEDDARITYRWRNTFGATFQFKGLFNVTRELYTIDTMAINHITKDNSIYQKLARNAKDGLLGVDGDAHRRQAGLLARELVSRANANLAETNYAFGSAQIHNLTEVFLEKSVEVIILDFAWMERNVTTLLKLRDVWTRKIGDECKPTRIDVFEWLSKATLDVIGQAGKFLCFDYHLDSLNPDRKPNDIHDSFNKLFHSPNVSRQTTLRMMQRSILLLRIVPLPGRKVFNDTRSKLFTLGNKLLVEGKAGINAAGGSKAVSGSRDLFSLVLRANMSTDISDDRRMSDDEVIGQFPTFFVAGHATTSSAISWALHALSKNQCAQAKLREELLTVATENPTLDELNSLQYLDSVSRTSFASLSWMISYPLATPCLDTQGRKLTSLPIRKGQRIRIPISDVNMDTTLWGDDAVEFRPERWQQIPKTAEAIPGVWGNMLTFLAGPYNCIGFRFALAEQKVLLFVLIRAFEFERARF